MAENYFNELNSVDVSEHVEKKGKLSYLSWVFAWREIKKRYPNANYKVYESMLPDGYQVNYFSDGRTAFVKVGVTVNDIEHIEYLPVMDYNNKSIPNERMTSFDVNTAIQRALTKAIARHGLGLFVYAGEDLPQIDTDTGVSQKAETNAEDQKRSEALVFIKTSFDLLSKEEQEKLLNWCDGKGWGRDFNTMHNEMLGVVVKTLKNKGK